MQNSTSIVLFSKTHNEIWNQLPFDAQQLLKGAGLSYGQTLNDKGYALKEGLEYYRSLGGFLFQLLMMTYSPYCIIIIKNKLNSLLNNVIYKNENPYEILGVSQDANNPQILKAMTTAMRKRVF